MAEMGLKMKTIVTILIALMGIVVMAETPKEQAPAPVPALPRTALMFSDAPNNGVTVTLAGKKYVLPGELSLLDKAGKAEGLTFGLRAASFPTEVRISSVTHEAVMEAAGFEGWGSKLGVGDSCSIQVNFHRQIIDMIAPAANTNGLVLRFHDGGKASMGGGSTLRYDEFKDRSYYVSGSGKVHAENADGQGMELMSFVPPMTGGPIVEETGPDGVKRNKRLSPVVIARGAGELLEKVLIGMQKEQFQLEREGQKTVVLTNGTEVVVYMSPDRTALRWRVTKGYVKFGMESIRCFQAQILTDQKADFQWDTTNLMVDTHNNSDADIFPANRDILCSVSRSVNSSTGPGGTFQYALLDDCDKFVASGYGTGKVQMYNTRTGVAFELQQGTVQFRSGVPVGTGSAAQKPQIKLSWADGSPLKVAGPDGSTSVSPGGKETLTVGGGNGELGISYSGAGVVGIESIQGDFQLLPKMLQDWTFDVGVNDSVTFTLDSQKGIFMVHSQVGNNNPVSVGSPDGFNPVLYPDSTITFVLGPTGLTLGKTDGTIVFYEAAGGAQGAFGQGPVSTPIPTGGTTPPTFGSTTTTVVDPTRLNGTRVEQAPVTTFN